MEPEILYYKEADVLKLQKGLFGVITKLMQKKKKDVSGPACLQ